MRDAVGEPSLLTDVEQASLLTPIAIDLSGTGGGVEVTLRFG